MAFVWEPRIERVLLDLAIQAAGGLSVPHAGLPTGTGSEPESSDPPPELGTDDTVEPPTVLDLETPAPGATPVFEELRAGSGGVRVRDAEGRVLELRGAELGALAAHLGLAAGFEPPPAAIWVSGHPLWDPAQRLVFTAALHAGAATVLAPPEAHVSTAAWARPTVFSGDATEVAALVEAAKSYRSPFPRGLFRRIQSWVRQGLRRTEPLPAPPPFDRLRTVLVRTERAGLDRAMPEPVADFLRDRGVRILPLPTLLDAAPWQKVV